MPANVWILNPSYRDGPHQLLRMGWITHIEQDNDGQVVVHDSRGNKFFPVRMSKKAEVPTDFGLQLLQALDRARRAAAELESDRVVAARRSEDGWSWQVYAPDDVPPAQDDPPPPPSKSTFVPPPPPIIPRTVIPNPAEMPLWAPQEQPEPDTPTE
ncbi:hypothetical protein [Streptomyces sp. NBC_00847]|uniref:hypothetical protein n=1 Tax=Streptomyces sp. NBC_00847 TaxID=2975850 RepID=UPI00225E5134|nr:hypothetical protein [Streptomyces sp. NBC_00847]MCX4885966.1 hypothetical protein [Streptomyces sp. NBC_00847]